MSFEETAMQLVLAKVNAVAIKSMFGNDVRDWLRKRLTLYATTEIMPFPKRRDSLASGFRQPRHRRSRL